jgi:polyisoprenoid-binding protein YceI
VRITTGLTLVILFSQPSWSQVQATALAESYELRPRDRSRFALEVHKSKLWEGRKHTFLFDRYHGALYFSRQQPATSSIEFAVVSASARCVDDWVKPGQIADIERAARETMGADVHAEIRFRSTTIQAVSENRFEVRGMLTIRNETKPIVLNVAAEPSESGLRLAGSGTLKLSSFGLKPPRGAVFLFIGTKDEMTVRFDLLAQPTAR